MLPRLSNRGAEVPSLPYDPARSVAIRQSDRDSQFAVQYHPESVLSTSMFLEKSCQANAQAETLEDVSELPRPTRVSVGNARCLSDEHTHSLLSVDFKVHMTNLPVTGM